MFVAASVRTDTPDRELPSCVNTGSAICARKGMIVNTFMSMICLRCQNVISSLNLVSSTSHNEIYDTICTHLGECHNKDCPYQHIDPESKIKDCFWYDRGYCKHGRLIINKYTK